MYSVTLGYTPVCTFVVDPICSASGYMPICVHTYVCACDIVLCMYIRIVLCNCFAMYVCAYLPMYAVLLLVLCVSFHYLLNW